MPLITGLNSPLRDGRLRVPTERKINTAVDGAVLSHDERYRYLLFRAWGGVPENYPVVLFIMLNPSTADAVTDDPTIRRCIAYAKRWGFFRLAVLNLFALRATDPGQLLTVHDPIGPENMRYISALGGMNPSRVVTAWGKVPKGLYGQENRVKEALRNTGRICHYLKLNKDGSPGHPLYLPAKIDLTEQNEWIP
jgi:hypothetical protein